jgi:hypothetical protein
MAIWVRGLGCLLLLCVMLPAAAAQPAATAGPALTRALPITEVTLFGHATHATHAPLNVTWTQTGGPPATLVSPRAHVTTVQLTTAGTYTFQLAVSDGTTTATASTTVTLTAAATTSFYVDPQYTGATQTGSATQPWKSLWYADGTFAARWATIRSALAAGDVIIYFPARQSGADTAVTVTNQTLFINRGCRTIPAGVSSDVVTSICTATGVDTTGNHQLVLDGMTLYDPTPASPPATWTTYTGTHRFSLVGNSESIALGWNDRLQRDHITVRGFDISGAAARVSVGGSDLTLEHVTIHDLTGLDPTFLFDNNISDCVSNAGGTACTNAGACTPIGPAQYVTFRNNTVKNGDGEAFYLGGTYFHIIDGGCPRPTYTQPTNSDLLMENNLVDHPGANGGQGDGFDLKTGWIWVTYRNNTILAGHDGTGGGGGDGFPMLGPWPDQGDANYLWEGNLLEGSDTGAGMVLQAIQGQIRNNVIYGYAQAGLNFSGDCPATPNHAAGPLEVYNNTIYNNLTGITFTCQATAPANIVLRNNLIFGNGTGTQIQNSGDVGPTSSDYNVLAPLGSDYPEGGHTVVHPTITDLVANAAGHNFTLTSTSVARNAGQPLNVLGNLPSQDLSLLLFTDQAGTPRPTGSPWDVGAYQYGVAPPPVPTLLKLGVVR